MKKERQTDRKKKERKKAKRQERRQERKQGRKQGRKKQARKTKHVISELKSSNIISETSGSFFNITLRIPNHI